MTAAWATISPANLTGFTPAGGGTGGLDSGVSNAAPTPARIAPPPWSPDNALFWVAVFLAGTVGLYALSVNVKSGAAKASLSI